MGLATYSTKVEHVHENRYRGVQLVTLPYLTFTFTLPYLALPCLTLVALEKAGAMGSKRRRRRLG